MSSIVAVDVQVLRAAIAVGQAAESDRMVDAILSHVAIGSPFAAYDREQAGMIDMDGVVARERRGFAVAAPPAFTSGRMPT